MNERAEFSAVAIQQSFVRVFESGMKTFDRSFNRLSP